MSEYNKNGVKEHFIQVYKTDESYNDLVENFCQVLDDLGIDCFDDEEEAEKRGCDLFIRLNRREGQV